MTWRDTPDASKPPSAASVVSDDDYMRTRTTNEPAILAYQAGMVDARDLIGASEVLELCGWKTRKSIGDQAGFPPPVASVSGTRIWLRTQVTAWNESRTIKPPAQSSSSTRRGS